MLLTGRLLEGVPGLLHGFTDRSDGNIAFHVGEAYEAVDLRQQRLAERVGYRLEALTHMRQVHGDRILSPGTAEGYTAPLECDALVTDRPGRPLMVMVADCTPLLLCDPRRRVIAAVHAGRAGALADIAGKTVRKMADDFGSAPGEILALLGPSIGPCCYEVGESIGAEAAALGYAEAVVETGNRICLDVNAIIIRQLKEAGLADTHIETSGRCTSCESERFFSYRADRRQTGRFAGVIMLTR